MTSIHRTGTMCRNGRDCRREATREFCYPAEPWVPYCDAHPPQYVEAGDRPLTDDRSENQRFAEELKDAGKLALLRTQLEALPRIQPSELEPEELFNRNGEYVNWFDVEQILAKLGR